jgi:hypothetical protein
MSVSATKGDLDPRGQRRDLTRLMPASWDAKVPEDLNLRPARYERPCLLESLREH